MKIGLISDTHGKLPSSVYKHFKNVNYIFHAGDIGGYEIINELEQIAPVIAVSGNMDDWQIKNNIPAISFTTLENKVICLIHDIGNMNAFCNELIRKKQKADIVIYGHTHRSSCKAHQHIKFVNPGSSLNSGNNKPGTIALMFISDNEISIETIELHE